MQQENKGESFLDLWQQVVSEVESETPKPKRKKHKRIKDGEIVETNNGYAKVLEYINSNNVKIRFIATQYETVATAANIRDSKVKDRLLESASGGFLGNASVYINGKPKPYYANWKSMFARVRERENYKNVPISNDFQSFEVFESWYLERKSKYQETVPLALDSDLIPFVTDAPKSYSAETCLLLPHSVNTSFTKTKESLDSFRTEKPKGIYQIGGQWIVFTLNDKSQFEDKADAVAYATDLLISSFMMRFRDEVQPYLNEIDLAKVHNLEQKLRFEFC